MKEIEAKYPVESAAEAEEVLFEKTRGGGLSFCGSFRMRAEYFDSPDGFLKKLHGALRLRHENEDTVCTLKHGAADRDGVFIRQEYECRAKTPEEGLVGLPGEGAPREICRTLLEKGLRKTADMEFERKTFVYRAGGLTAELALDAGRLWASGRSAPVCELEIELKQGTAEEFRLLLKKIEKKYGLVPSNVSKYAAALLLSAENDRDSEEDGIMEEKKAVNPFYVASELLNYCIREGYVEFCLDEDKKIHYYVAKDGEQKLRERFGIAFECPCAMEKPE